MKPVSIHAITGKERHGRFMNHHMAQSQSAGRRARAAYILLACLLLPLAAHAQSPLDNGINNFSTFMTGTFARGVSLIVIVLAGFAIATGEGRTKAVAITAIVGVVIMNAAASFMAWVM